MLFDKAPETPQGRFFVGFDLRDDYCQISYMENPGRRPPKEPATFSLLPGQEKFDIPTAIAKAARVNHWSCGLDAQRAAADGSSTYIPKLLSLALEGQLVRIEDSEYEPTALLALFVNRCLALISTVVPTSEISAIMFTARQMNEKMIGILENVKQRLNLACDVFYEGYANSFYNFLLMQADTVREPGSILCEYTKDGPLRISKMRYNLRVRPHVAYREEQVIPGLYSEDADGRDSEFLKILTDAIGRDRFSSVYLIGNGFDGKWMKRSILFLCKGRRAFIGNNLYSKGAGYGAYCKICNPEIAQDYYFLDSNRLKANIGIRGLQKGSTVLHSILDAGVNWYEAAAEDDVILEDGNEVHLTLTPLTGGQSKDFLIRLDGLPMREGRTTRIRMHFSMSAPDKVKLFLEDMGFGEIFPSSGLRWEQTITID